MGTSYLKSTCTACGHAQELYIGNLIRLPLDMRTIRPAGITEKTLGNLLWRWFIFGHSPNGKTVDVADVTDDVFQHVPVAVAEQLVQERERHLSTVVEILRATESEQEAGQPCRL